MTARAHDWDASYQSAAPPPWDIGRPQPAFVRLAESGVLAGRVLDAGCGTGEHALLAAARGAEVIGIDLSQRAIWQARRKAAERGVSARFEVADALSLGRHGWAFDTVIDSGLFHVFDDEQRGQYVTSLASVLGPGGNCYLMCFSDREPGVWGPRRVREDELAAAFADGWSTTSITADTFAINPIAGSPVAQAWLATIRRERTRLSGFVMLNALRQTADTQQWTVCSGRLRLPRAGATVATVMCRSSRARCAVWRHRLRIGFAAGFRSAAGTEGPGCGWAVASR